MKMRKRNKTHSLQYQLWNTKMRSILTRLVHRTASIPNRKSSFASFANSSNGVKNRNLSALAEGIGEYHLDVSRDGKAVSVFFPQSSSSSFHAPWLWVNDPSYIHPTSGQRMRSLGQYPGCRIVSANILEGQFLDYPPSPPGFFHSRGGVYQQPSSVTKDTENRNVLHVVWDSKDESLFDLDWLSRQRYDASQSFSSRITKDLAIGAIDNPDCVPIPALDYQEVMQTDEGLFQALQGIFERGAVLIRQAPKKSDGEDLESTVADLGKHLAGGQLSHGSLYGDVFHVQSMGDANNIAYTNLQLPPHQDLVYYESKPFLQLLHCAHDANKVVGGESVLIDAMSAAEELRNLVPDLFDILCRVNATFLKQREGADMVSLKPHIVIDPANGEVVTVNWSPPFEGPSHISPDLFERYVLAYQAMECMLDSALPEGTTLLPPSLECKLRGYARKYTWEYALQAGDVMVFNNQRMLHARRAFSTREDGQRHLIGCYTDVMETTNRYRLLLRERGGKESGMRNAGNGTRAIYL